MAMSSKRTCEINRQIRIDSISKSEFCWAVPDDEVVDFGIVERAALSDIVTVIRLKVEVLPCDDIVEVRLFGSLISVADFVSFSASTGKSSGCSLGSGPRVAIRIWPSGSWNRTGTGVVVTVFVVIVVFGVLVDVVKVVLMGLTAVVVFFVVYIFVVVVARKYDFEMPVVCFSRVVGLASLVRAWRWRALVRVALVEVEWGGELTRTSPFGATVTSALHSE